MAKRVLALDLSTHCGWASLEGEAGAGVVPALLARGRVDLVRVKGEAYPWNYVHDVERQANNLALLVGEQRPDEVVIEETNGGGRAGRYTQKLLEMLHLALLQQIGRVFPGLPVVYVSSSDWRSACQVTLTKEERKKNAALSKAKRVGADALKVAKKALGVKGRTTKKHAAVRWANATFGLALLQGDNDTAEAIALGTARFRGAPICTGGEHRKDTADR